METDMIVALSSSTNPSLLPTDKGMGKVGTESILADLLYNYKCLDSGRREDATRVLHVD